MPRCTDEDLEDKMLVGGPGLANIRKSKAGINVEKAYGFLVRTWVRLPPGPHFLLRREVSYRKVIQSRGFIYNESPTFLLSLDRYSTNIVN